MPSNKFGTDGSQIEILKHTDISSNTYLHLPEPDPFLPLKYHCELY